eukprot:TRINITY_DN12910_c0_g1_i1.p1 TRINITY_DN12910_c0_g1~~TRINITY_DN12910_c0_g1_i1.p1  ORF type:complete len:395 (-),score=48.10 TRINITY_DN12910_c0_g1_i1:85-1248(-)
MTRTPTATMTQTQTHTISMTISSSLAPTLSVTITGTQSVTGNPTPSITLSRTATRSISPSMTAMGPNCTDPETGKDKCNDDNPCTLDICVFDDDDDDGIRDSDCENVPDEACDRCFAAEDCLSCEELDCTWTLCRKKIEDIFDLEDMSETDTGKKKYGACLPSAYALLRPFSYGCDVVTECWSPTPTGSSTGTFTRTHTRTETKTKSPSHSSVVTTSVSQTPPQTLTKTGTTSLTTSASLSASISLSASVTASLVVPSRSESNSHSHFHSHHSQSYSQSQSQSQSRSHSQSKAKSTTPKKSAKKSPRPTLSRSKKTLIVASDGMSTEEIAGVSVGAAAGSVLVVAAIIGGLVYYQHIQNPFNFIKAQGEQLPPPESSTGMANFNQLP